LITENLSTLKINKLTKAQYERELAAGNIDPNALYLTPDEGVDLSPYATVEQLNTLVGEETVAEQINTAISDHNTSTDAHSDIRLIIEELATEEYVDDKIANIDIPDSGIIDVIELPTENINENVFYRVPSGYPVYNQYFSSDYNVYFVETLPETGIPVTNADQSEGNVYYCLSDNKAYGYVDEMLSMGMGVPSGWYDGAVLLGALGYEYKGVINNIQDDPMDDSFRILLDYKYYAYKNNAWISYRLGRAGTGEFSEAFNLSKASGDYSHAEGKSSHAEGKSSHAEGDYSHAKGQASHAEGYDSHAEGDDSHAEGSQTYAEGSGSHAEGWNSHAEGHYSHAEGEGSHAEGNYSHAEGDHTHAEGYYSHAEGSYSHAEEDHTHAEGYGSHAEGAHSHAEGSYSHAEGAHSHAEGYSSHAEGYASHAEGSGTYTRRCITGATNVTVYTIDSTANLIVGASIRHTVSNNRGIKSYITAKILEIDNVNNTITVDRTLSESSALNNESVEIYIAGMALGKNSHSEGNGTTAAGRSQHTQGEYNVIDPEYDVNDSTKRGKYAHIVGNGTDIENRSNAHTIDWNGLGWFKDGLKVGGTSQDDVNAKTIATEEYVDDRIANIDIPDSGVKKEEILTETNIIRQDILPEGYPYASHGTVVPTITLDFSEGTAPILENFVLSPGSSYTVTWNGVEYECVAETFTLDGLECVGLGDYGVFMEQDPTGKPFAIAYTYEILVEAVGAYGMALALDGSTEATLSIDGYKIQKIDKAFLPDTTLKYIVDGIMPGSIKTISASADNDEYMIGSAAAAFGYETKASGDSSHAEGYWTTASGEYSHAEGYWTTASGQSSHAEGDYSHAEGEISHAEGYKTHATGGASHAEGYSTHAAGKAQHVQGEYNITDPLYNPERSDARAKYAHIVGNGTGESNRSNAHTLDWEGNAWFQGQIKVGGTGQDDVNAKTIATEEYVDNKIANIDIPDSGIIDVIELPTENINENAFYRLLTGAFVYNGFAYAAWTCRCVVSLPETGEPVFSGDLSDMSTVSVTAYYNVSDQSVYAYITEELSAMFGVTAGWYPIEVIMNAVGATFSGIITDIADDPNDDTYRFLLEYVIYSYKDKWTSHKIIGRIGTGGSAEVFNHVSNIASGDASHAEGYHTHAQGYASHAEGYYSHAEGDYSHAEGYYSHAEGSGSHAEGSGSHAEGSNSHAEGSGSHAEGSNSHAEGSGSHAEGYASHAEGNNSHAEGSGSHAEGSNSHAEGDYSHAEGYGTHTAGRSQHVQGEYNIIDPLYNPETPDARAKYAHIVGNGSYSKPSNAHTLDWSGLGWFAGGLKVGGTGQDDVNAKEVAFKDEVIGKNVTGETFQIDGADVVALSGAEIFNNYSNNIATGSYSHAEGNITTASGSGSHAEGSATIASGDYSHAEGEQTTAFGNISHAEGANTVASGAGSHAEGYDTSAIGFISHTEGAGTIASGDYQHVQGKYNIEDTENKYAHIVGNGESKNARSNVHTVDWNGLGWFKDGLKVGGTSQDDSNAVEVALKSDIPSVPVTSVNNKTGAIQLTASDVGALPDTTVIPSIEGLATTNYVDTKVSKKPGEIVTGKSYTIDDVTVKAQSGSEIFNDYNNNIATGNYSHAEGSYTIASGNRSHAEGHYTIASGHNSHAEGDSATSSGYNSHAEGEFTIASNQASHAEGAYTIASGIDSHAEGCHTTASGNYSHVQGKYNIDDTENKYAHIVGNGTNINNSNAHTVDWNGLGWFKNGLKIGGISQDDVNAKTIATEEYVNNQIRAYVEEAILGGAW